MLWDIIIITNTSGDMMGKNDSIASWLSPRKNDMPAMIVTIHDNQQFCGDTMQ